MNKEELKLKVQELEEALADVNASQVANESLANYNKETKENLELELERANQGLKEVGKPVVTLEFLTELLSNIENTLNNFGFDDISNYSYDFGINYDNQIELENFEFDVVHDIFNVLKEDIEESFNYVEENY